MATRQATPSMKPHLSGDAEADPHGAIDRGEKVASLMEHPGWGVLLESLGEYAKWAQRGLMLAPPRAEDSAQIYDRHFGEMNGLRLLPALAEGVVETGRDARERITNAA